MIMKYFYKESFYECVVFVSVIPRKLQKGSSPRINNRATISPSKHQVTFIYSNTINAYNEDFAPLWTGVVLLPIFGKGSIIATSAAVESEFCDIKNRAFKGEPIF